MSQMYVTITNGMYRNQQVNGTFLLLEDVKVTGSGKRVINVLGALPEWSQHKCRVTLGNDATVQYSNEQGEVLDLPNVIRPFVGENNNNNVPASSRGTVYEGTAVEIDYEKQYQQLESENDAMNRIKRTFEIVNELTEAAAAGEIRSMIISGPPGIGKSFGVEETLNRCFLLDKIKDNKEPFEIVKGAASAIGVYQKLYEFKDKGKILIFDDCDRVLFDEDSLNLLKGALDTTKRRTIYWLSESRVLKENDIPPKFDFEGSVIFLTNLNFEDTKSRIGRHLEAIMSRCHYLDMEISSTRDQILRIKQVVRDGMLSKYEFNNGEDEEILEYIIDNQNDLRELSLRMVIKIADLIKFKKDGWREYAETTVLKRNAKFRRLYNEKYSDI
ncbi:hypothetical protein Cassandra_0165 [Pseudomonas phage Cassandra]|nr:hypothetical protein Cassandra_0165 [Pseudomonas phage Cassandra]